MGRLIGRWLENGVPRYDLEWFANRRNPIPREDQADVLDTRLGYLNTLYGGQLRVPFDRLQDWQSGVLVYAIAQKKRHFLSLVNENFETFSTLDRYSLVLQEDFYRRCNLNTLTLQDLKASEGRRGHFVHLKYLNPGTYTFQELNLLAYAREMKFSDEFIAENRQGVLRFLLNEGAEMSRMFYDCTDREDTFRRIIQAELLGKFHTLKYFPDDLEKELSYPVGRDQQLRWQENTSRRAGPLTVSEEDDFYTTLRLGELPGRTCLSYRGGTHMDCLLFGYDSNKKILLARRGGEVVGRAVIRLTKGTFYAPEQEKSVSLQFADLSQDRPKEEDPLAQTREYLTLFLERLYVSHCSPEETDTIRKLFVELVREKATSMGALSVLAGEYSCCCESGGYARMGYYSKRQME